MSDIVTALGPDRKLDYLKSFAHGYVTVHNAFNNLLVFPHLEAIEIEDTSGSNLLSLVADGNSRFSWLSNVDIALARKVISYDGAFSALVDTLDIQMLVETLQPIAQEYADHSRAQSEVNRKFFADFTDYIASIDERIRNLDAKLAELDEKIQGKSEELAGRDIVSALREVLNVLYKLSTNAEDVDVQIAPILGVTVATIAGSFKTLYDDQYRFQKVISELTGFRFQILDLRIKFSALSASLEFIFSSRSLLDVWDDVAAHLDTVTVADDMSSLPAPQSQQLKEAWAKATTDAKDYIDVLQRSAHGSSVESHRVISAKFNATPKVPTTEEEVCLHRLAAVHGHDALCAPGRFPLLVNPSIDNPLRSSNDEKTIETVLGPPAETQKRLNDLADCTGRVINQFNILLQQPYLNQYRCKDPIDNSDSDLFTLVAIYHQRYLRLQLDSLPVARDLHAHAELQKTLLPLVVPDALAQETDLSMSAFLAAQAPVIKEYLEKANELSRRSTQMKYDWDNVVNSVKKLVKECIKNIKPIKDKVRGLTKKRRNMTLHAFFYGCGALIAFTGAAFLPGGMLTCLAIGSALGNITLLELYDPERGELTTAINVLNDAVTTAENTIANIRARLLPHVGSVAENLLSISHFWSNITTALTTLMTSFNTILNSPAGPALFNSLRPTIIENWEAVWEAANQYIQVVS